MKSIWFDMDGTIAELYKVEGWLEALRSMKQAESIAKQYKNVKKIEEKA